MNNKKKAILGIVIPKGILNSEFDILELILDNLNNATIEIAKHKNITVSKKFYKLYIKASDVVTKWKVPNKHMTAAQLIATKDATIDTNKRFKKLSKEIVDILGISGIDVTFEETNNPMNTRVAKNISSKYLQINYGLSSLLGPSGG